MPRAPGVWLPTHPLCVYICMTGSKWSISFDLRKKEVGDWSAEVAATMFHDDEDTPILA